MKKIMLLGGALIGALALTPSAIAGQGAGGCQLAGTANFDKGLAAPGSVTTNYNFGGTLSNCQGTFSDTGGKVSAGQPIVINGVTYNPIDKPSLTGGCASSTTSGTSFVAWANGTYSAIKYSTTGAAAAVVLQGTFEKSVTLTTSQLDANGNPLPPLTLSNLAYGGDYAGGPLAFQPPDPTACNTATGVTSAGISGFIGHGNYQ